MRNLKPKWIAICLCLSALGLAGCGPDLGGPEYAKAEQCHVLSLMLYYDDEAMGWRMRQEYVDTPCATVPVVRLP